MQLTTLKYHGSGNEFLLIDESKLSVPLNQTTRASITRSICDRASGIGADGSLFYSHSSTADCKMQMFNPDGSEAEMCGNGLRCLARYAVKQLGKNTLSVETMKATLLVNKEKDIYPHVPAYRVEIAPVTVDRETINQTIPKLSDKLNFTSIQAPNPHIITIVDNIDDEIVNKYGQKANQPDIFPQGVNVSFIRLLEENTIFVRTYERGVGITNSCGTAMSASAFVAALLGKISHEQPVNVLNQGGMVICTVPDPSKDTVDSIYLNGNATFMFQSTVEIDSNYCVAEQTDYANLQQEVKNILSS